MAISSEPEDGEIEFEDGEISDDSSDPDDIALAIVRPAFRPRPPSSTLCGSDKNIAVQATRADGLRRPTQLREHDNYAQSNVARYVPPGCSHTDQPRFDNLRSSYVAGKNTSDCRGSSNAEAMYRQCVTYIKELQAWGVSAECMISKGVSKRLVHDVFTSVKRDPPLPNAVHYENAAAEDKPPQKKASDPRDALQSHHDTVTMHESQQDLQIRPAVPKSSLIASASMTADSFAASSTHFTSKTASLSSVRPLDKSQSAENQVESPLITGEDAVSQAMQSHESTDSNTTTSSGTSMSLDSLPDLNSGPPAVTTVSPLQKISISLPPRPCSPAPKRCSPPPETLSMQASVQKLSSKLYATLPPRPPCVIIEPNVIHSNMRCFTELESREANVKALLRRRGPAKKPNDSSSGEILQATSPAMSELSNVVPIASKWDSFGHQQMGSSCTSHNQLFSASSEDSLSSATSEGFATQSNLDVSIGSQSPCRIPDDDVTTAMAHNLPAMRTPKRPLAFDFDEEPTSTLPLTLQKSTLRPFCVARSVETIIFDEDDEFGQQIAETPYIAALRLNFRECRSAISIPSLSATTYRAPTIQEASRASSPANAPGSLMATSATVAYTAGPANRASLQHDVDRTKLAQTEAALTALKAKLAAIEEARARRQSSQFAASMNVESH